MELEDQDIDHMVQDWLDNEKPIEATKVGLHPVLHNKDMSCFTYVWNGEEQTIVDMQTINVLRTVYNAIRPDLQVKIDSTVRKSRNGLMKFIDLAWRSVK